MPESMDSMEKQRLLAMLLRGEDPNQPQQRQGGPGPGMTSQFIPGGGGGGGGGGMGAAGPWVGLAAAIAANETWANSQGRRPEKFGDHMKDLASGKVLEYDAGALADQMPGKTGDLLKFDAAWGNPSGALGNVKKLMPWEWF